MVSRAQVEAGVAAKWPTNTVKHQPIDLVLSPYYEINFWDCCRSVLLEITLVSLHMRDVK